MAQDRYAQVILPLPLDATFTYGIPPDMAQRVMPGHRVIVPFGARKQYTGLVESIVTEKGEYDIKNVSVAPDEHPIIRHPQMQLWRWMADYYMCSLGDVFKAALPAGLKIESETRVEAIDPESIPFLSSVKISREFSKDETVTDSDKADTQSTQKLTVREDAVYQALLGGGAMTPHRIEKETGLKGVSAIVNRLIEKGAVRVSERLNERYRARRIDMVRPAFGRDEKEIASAFAKVKGAPKQETMLMALIHLSNVNRPNEPLHEVTRSTLLEYSGSTTTILRELVKKGLVEPYTKEVSRFKYNGEPIKPLPRLSDAQVVALDEIHKSLIDHNVTLLHGVTSSGKTEVYIHLIDHVLRQGRQVLMLVPEIALTTQLTQRMQRVFGSRVVIYHSRFSDNERVDIWKNMLNDSAGNANLIIGARSAVFLPFRKLGLVIVDEEHETSYKQQDPAPRYNGRDTAIVLASLHGAKTVLGSATPSVETYYKAIEGKYGLVSLTERYGGASLPPVRIVDMADQRRRKVVSGMFSETTVNAVRKAVENHRQAIIFQNRRGFAPIAECSGCAYVPKCKDCDVSLTYHKSTDTLQCHYCGATYPLPKLCPVCGEPTIELYGYGTERLHDDIEEKFPNASVLRMDLDTTRDKDAYSSIIDRFSRHEADILVGTQMVTKGLDFGEVSVVAILNADALINKPDFRSAEHAYNMLEQVAGRAGRRNATQGADDDDAGSQVIVQTSQPESPVIKALMAHDYKTHYECNIKQRRAFAYPPFSRVINIHMKHSDAQRLDRLAGIFASNLRSLFGNRIFGPDKPVVSRVQTLHIRTIMMKIEPQASLSKVKRLLDDARKGLLPLPDARSLVLYFDVDPL